jgi:DNA-binding response OmpR family regulator
MPGRRILVVGRHPEIMHKVKALLESGGFTPIGAQTDEEAFALMRSAEPDALLLGGGVEQRSREVLAASFAEARPGRPVIEHFGGPHGLLDHVRSRL